jgi:hypothetical protein
MTDEQIVLGGGSEKNQSNQANNIPREGGQNIPLNNEVEDKAKKIAAEHNIPQQYLDSDFMVPTEEIKLPSGGAFYPNKKNSVTIKYLTAEEDDILFSPDLIKSGRVLDVLLDRSVIDKDLRPENMISGDRNYILIQMRKTGLGNDYNPGEMQCGSCSEIYSPTIDLEKLKAKNLEVQPDELGEYDVMLPIMKMNLKFRLLTGQDEKRLGKLAESGGSKSGGIKVKKLITEKYIMQIMEVNGNRDKLYIKKFISAMPMRDSMFFREYLRRIEPGLDLSYEFECPHCGEIEIKDTPITPKLFYPDLEQ